MSLKQGQLLSVGTFSTRLSPLTECSWGAAEKVQMSWLKGGFVTSAVSSDSAIATCAI